MCRPASTFQRTVGVPPAWASKRAGCLRSLGSGSQDNLRTTVIAVSFGKNKMQQDISKTTDKGEKVDDVASFQ